MNQLDKKKKIDFLRQLYKIRFFEEKAIELFLEGFIVGDLHPYIGEEAIAVGACGALEKSDYILSTHRGHGHCIAKGEDVKKMMAEILGKVTGSCKGRGGSMHICNKDIGILGANGIIGGGLAIAVGAAISSLYRKTDQVTVCFFGDGGANQGVFHESLNLASLWKLPVIFICENNQIAATTPVEEVIPTKNISGRATCYGIYGNTIDGNDVEEVYREISKRVKEARDNKSPSLIECVTYRHKPHCMAMVDSRKNTEEEAEKCRRLDPVLRYEKKLLDEKVLDKKEISKLKEEIVDIIEESAAFAKSSPFPDKNTVNDWVYLS